jgi:hypothetical protein
VCMSCQVRWSTVHVTSSSNISFVATHCQSSLWRVIFFHFHMFVLLFFHGFKIRFELFSWFLRLNFFYCIVLLVEMLEDILHEASPTTFGFHNHVIIKCQEQITKFRLIVAFALHYMSFNC